MDICKKSALWLAMTAAMSANAVAQQEATTEQHTTPEQENVVVWGTKVSSSSESLTTDDLSLKQADHMSDLLRDIPGVDVGGTHSVNQRINIRGFGETDLDIRLDGASQHANMFHHIGNLTLNPDILKSADVQVGNNSVTQNGLGGAVYFETKNAKDLLMGGEQFGARIFGGYASNDSQQGSLTVYGQLSETVDAMVYGQGISRDNFEDGSGKETFGVAGDTYNVLAKVGFEPADGHRFQLSYDVYRDNGDYSPRPDMAGTANEGLTKNRLIPTRYDRDTITGSYELKKDQHRGKVTLYSSQTEIDRDETVMAGAWPGNRVSHNTATNHNMGANALFQSDYELVEFRNQVTYGLDYIDQTSKATYGSTPFMEESAISTALFAENKLYVTEAWSVTAGLRFDDFQRKAMTGSKDFDELTWSLGTEWDVNSDWTLFANARSLFKGPELLETFVRYQDVARLADNIKAETGLNTQGGVRFDKKFGEHFVGANFTLFNTKIDDHIRTNNSYLISNVGDMEIKGFELSTTYAYQAASAKFSYARSDADDVTNGGPMLNSVGSSADMGDSLALTLGYQADSIDTLFGWTSIVVLDEDNVVAGSDKKEGYDVHNLYAQWTPYSVPNLVLTFGVDNVFDELYVSHASRIGLARSFVADDYEPGRSYKLSAAYQF
ncbi:TonB-dependent siderophore receptor [Vibrio mimicus]|uniref:TonB-dependent siderophore receptor n=1 Tax=Vibrio mimicus TaxID=674 RepID=UPI0001BAE153|nr:TonB-dependent siderophore receptor [Vibrio mimicus]EEY36273.1 enterobactin receptor VctA [Vibrio mimicus MB451]